MNDHAEIALDYCRQVVAGDILACGWVIKACARQLDDIARAEAGDPDFPYRWEPDRGSKVCRFIESFKIFEGPLTGQPIQLQPWQCNLITTIYGWVCRGGKRDGKRRFRRVLIELPRGQGKSALCSALGIYHLAADGEGGAQVVAAGTSRDVAKIIFRAAQEMAKTAPELMAALGVQNTAHMILQPRTASRFTAISADSKTSDGKNLAACFIDETHLHKDRRLIDSLETAMGKRDQSIMYSVTTAGTDSSGIAYEYRTYLTQILDQTHTDESTFGIIYTMPEGMDWLDPAAWRAANPGWDVTVMPEVIEQLAAKARVTPSAQNNFKTKHLSIWCSADESWADMEIWRNAGDANLDIEDFIGKPCFIGLDLAQRSDLCAKVYLFPEARADGSTHYTTFTRAYLPETAVKLGKNSSYRGWELEGRIEVTQGDVTDFDLIEQELLEDAQRFDVREVAFDPWQATQLSQRLMSAGINCIEVRPTVQNFSEPMKELDSLVRQGRLKHAADPVLLWNVSNVVCHTDKKDNIYPNKNLPHQKIDLVVAAIMALARAMFHEPQAASVYESRGLLVFG